MVRHPMNASAATGPVRPFGGYGAQEGDSRHWAASLLTSSAIYVVLGAVVAIVGGRQVVKVAEKTVDVKFVEKVAVPPPPVAVVEPPKPIPAPEVKPKPAAAAAPIVRPDQKVRKLDTPPPVKPLTVPKDMPTDAAPEADPSLDKGVAVYGDGAGDVAGLEGGRAGGVAGGVVGGVPEDADPPLPADSNLKPEYPESARLAGKMSTVVLKVVILADGSVRDVEVMKGEEPFVASALKAVKTWKFSPAKVQGKAVTVYQIIQIPFKLVA